MATYSGGTISLSEDIPIRITLGVNFATSAGYQQTTVLDGTKSGSGFEEKQFSK